ncbi:hypothetical protein Tco_0755235 [Tanacetum coccineum]
MAGEDDQNINNQPPNPPPPTQQAPHTVSTIKLPILKKGEYDIWAMKMEHYLAHTDYPVWEVIQNGNGPVSISTDTQGQIKILPPKSAEEILARERERKARTTLLMALPEDHLARFHNISDAKEMWDAIKTRFGGNAKNTGYKGRDQRTGKQEQPKALLTIDAGVIDWSGQAEEEEEDHALMAFNSNGSNNEVQSCSDECVASYNKLKQLYDEQREQLGDASIEIQAYTQALKKVEAQLVAHQQSQLWTSETKFVQLVNDRYCRGDACCPLPMTRDLHSLLGPDKEIDTHIYIGPKQYSKLVEYDIGASDFILVNPIIVKKTHESMPEIVVNEPKYSKFNLKFGLLVCSYLLQEYESDSEDEHVSLPTKEQEIPSFAFINTVKHVKTPRQTVKEQNTCSQSPKPDKKDCSGLMSKKLGLGYGYTRKACFVCGSFSHLIKDCDYYEKKMAKQAELTNRVVKRTGQVIEKPVWNNARRVNHENKFVPRTILINTGRSSVNTARPKVNTHAEPASTAKKISTARPKVNESRPKGYFYESQSQFRRPFNNTTALKTTFTKQKVNTARVNSVLVWGKK